MLGREVLPATLIARPPEEPVSVTVPFVKDLRDHIRAADTQVRRATRTAAKTQKTYYDRGVRGADFHVGQRVWLFWPSPPRRQRFRKLQQSWTGPWEMQEFRTDVVVVIKHTLRQTKQTVHIDRLSPCKVTDPKFTVSVNPPEVVEGQSNNAASTSSHQIPAEIEHQSRQPLAFPSAHSSSVERPRRKRRPRKLWSHT